MFYITQLIFLKEGMEQLFHQFEDHAIPLMEKYGAKMIFRLRPKDDAFVEGGTERPYEIHFISFESELDFKNFMKDEERKRYVHLKDQSVRSVILVKGARI